MFVTMVHYDIVYCYESAGRGNKWIGGGVKVVVVVVVLEGGGHVSWT